MKILLNDKADVEGFGTLILISITIIGIGLITLAGLPSVLKMQEMANVRNAEQAFTVLDSHTSRVSLGESMVQKTDINLGGGAVSVVPNSSQKSYVLIEMKNGSSVEKSIVLDMGKIMYRLGDRELGYEGGGIWSKYPSGSVMVSPPEVHYNGMTLTLPVVNVSGKSAYGGKGKVSISAQRNKDIKIIYPTKDLTNPISANISRVVITIYSEYYDAWADFFKGITFAKVSTNASEKKVTINLETPPVFTNFSYGALASDYIILRNNANIESYNSSKGGYLVSSSGNGSIRANNLVRFTNAAAGLEVNGSVISGVTIDGDTSCTLTKCRILKDAYARSYTGTVNVVGTKNTVTNDMTVTIGDAATKVAEKIDSFKSLNDNLGPCISGNVINGSWTGICTINKGNYYLTGFSMGNKDLLFNTSLGEINIAVDMPSSNINWDQANISISGNNPVKIWMNGGLNVGTGSKINRYGNPNDTSSRFQVVSSYNGNIYFQQGTTEFCGFVYAPRARIYVEQSAKILGALVGKQFEVKNSEDIYFDEALKNLPADLGEGVTIMYMHVTQNDIGVSID
ncbi:MAG: hypothetical protein KKA10_17425 [Euryarchaeota archaeon]|nr:hypothetical protein [Euryarchaeota archaeon]MCG2738381.1 hypothetical protein [Candidatus Methanoperedenaceae archaeon]